MKELIFRHLTASRKNLRFGLILSLGLFVFTFLIYLSSVCGNLKAMGIAESEVFPYLIMTFISLTAIVPMMTGLAGQSMKKDSDSGFQELQRNNLHSVIIHFVDARHTNILDYSQMSQIFLTESHPETCTFNGWEVFHQRFQFFVI